MKRFIVGVLIACVAFLFPLPAAAITAEEAAEDIGADRLEEAVPDSASEVMDGVSASQLQNTDELFSRLGSVISRESGGIFMSALGSAAVILVIAVLASAAESVCAPRYYGTVMLAAVLAVSASAAGNVKELLGLGISVTDELGTFSKVLLPTLTAAAAAGGAVTSAAAKYAATTLFIDILITVGNRVVLPLIYAYVAAAIADAAFGGGIRAVAGAIKWTAGTSVTLMVSAFTLYLTVTGTIASTTDAAAVKLTKAAISTAVPVVGGMLADAASAIAGAAAAVKSAVGIFGLFTVLSVCAVPFLRLGVHYLVYKGAAALSGTVADGRLSRLIGDIGSAFGLMLGLAGAEAVMLFISVMSLLKAVGI